MPYLPCKAVMETDSMPDDPFSLRTRSNRSEVEESRVARISSFPLDNPQGEILVNEHSKFNKTTLSDGGIDSPSNRRQLLESQQRLLWDETMCETLGIPRGYSQVSVLLIRWADHIADPELKAAEESAWIEKCFKENFHFNTIPIELSEESPQKELLNKVSEICQSLGPSSLFILYYNGHGSHHKVPSQLKLHPSESYTEDISFIWDNIEDILLDEAQGDIFTIMDACFAGIVRSVIQRRGDKAWEYLGACGQDEIIGTGNTSFSSAVAVSLENLFKLYGARGFNTETLLYEVTRFTRQRHKQLQEQNEKKRKRSAILPCFYSRHKSVFQEDDSVSPFYDSQEDHSICLVPLEKTPYFSTDQIPAHLRLNIELKDESLTDEQLKKLCIAICLAVKEVSPSVRTQRVDLMRLGQSPRLKFRRAVTKIQVLNRFTGSPIRNKSLIPIMAPGFYATYGVMDMRKQFHFKTFNFLKPGPKAIALGTFVVITYMGWHLRKVKHNLLVTLLQYIGLR